MGTGLAGDEFPQSFALVAVYHRNQGLQEALKENPDPMLRRTLPAILAVMFSQPLLAAQQTLFNFVRPTSVVNVVNEETSLPQYNAEQTAEGEVLRRVVFNPV